MKELSIEEKAKAYDEIIGKAKKELNACGSQDCDAARQIFRFFPELKEPEDEKMRKGIIRNLEYLMDRAEGFVKDELKERIAWLEKQDEQKPVDSTLEIKPKFKVGDTIRELETGNLFYVNSVEDFGYTLHYKNCNANGCTMSFKYEDKYELIEQNPAWSEEDEDILNTIINHFKIDVECTDEDDMVRWLKSLKDKVQPRQELNEKEIENCAREAEDNNCIILAKHIRQLKSLRPQSTWKPTEQQMKVLNEVINFAADHGTMRWNDYIYNVLKGLREQLKKLK